MAEKKKSGMMDKVKKAFGGKTAKPGVKRKKKPEVVFKAPDEFKPFFCKVTVKIGKDGLFHDISCIRVKGSLTNENAKTVDMSLWDPVTLRRLAARYGGATYVTNRDKRLPAGAKIAFVMRVGIKKTTGGLTTTLKDFKIAQDGEKKAKLLDKKDPIYRRARKPARDLGGAFTQVKPFPSAKELKDLTKEDTEETKVVKKSKKGK